MDLTDSRSKIRSNPFNPCHIQTVQYLQTVSYHHRYYLCNSLTSLAKHTAILQ